MRKLATLTLALSFIAPAFGADLAEIQASGKLRVLAVLDPTRPEFFSTAPDREPGFDHEIVQGFARLHKLELVVVPIEAWGDLVPALKARRGDLIAGRFSDTEARRKEIDFTVEVFPSRYVVITRKPTPRIDTIEELKRARVGTSAGSSMAEVIRKAGVPASRLDDSLPAGSYGEALRSGDVAAVVWGIESAVALQREDPDIELGLFLGEPNRLAYGVHKDSSALLQALNTYIENTRKTLTWNRLVVKYFGQAAPEILRLAREQ